MLPADALHGCRTNCQIQKRKLASTVYTVWKKNQSFAISTPSSGSRTEIDGEENWKQGEFITEVHNTHTHNNNNNNNNNKKDASLHQICLLWYCIRPSYVPMWTEDPIWVSKEIKFNQIIIILSTSIFMLIRRFSMQSPVPHQPFLFQKYKCLRADSICYDYRA